jgi:hypothetical protein
MASRWSVRSVSTRTFRPWLRRVRFRSQLRLFGPDRWRGAGTRPEFRLRAASQCTHAANTAPLPNHE